jgi:transposase-like protein
MKPISRAKARGRQYDFLFRAKRDKAAARRFFEKAIGQNGSPETATIDKSGSNLAALHAVNAGRESPSRFGRSSI